MKTLGIVTASRAEYGLLRPFIEELRRHEETGELSVRLIVTGTHLAEAYGSTVKEIENDGLRIDERVPIPVKTDNALAIAKNQAETLTAFTALFMKEQYDAVILLGDRYEMLMVAIAATNTLTPLIHISGGDTTEGAVDESIRHSITKMSYYHFTTNAESRRRVIQLGESPERVFEVGSTSLDNILRLPLLKKEEAVRGFLPEDCIRYALSTYHPVTLEDQDVRKDILAWLSAMKQFPDIHFIVTKTGADRGGELANEILTSETEGVSHIHVFESLGVLRYLSLMKYASFVLGNSSSGIVEVPAFHIPTINIGDRQRGRLQSESIINCGTSAEEITDAIRLALSEPMREKAARAVSPYGDGHAAEKMTDILLQKLGEPVDLKKAFYDL